MARVVITTIVNEVTDDEAMAIKKAIEELVKEKDGAVVRFQLTAR